MNDRPEFHVIDGATRESRIKLIAFDDIKLGTERLYLVNDLIPRGGLTVIWGPPKSGKSFWTFDLVMHLALGWSYRGRRVQQGAVVYCAFEGQSGIRRRIEAFRQRFLSENTTSVPFYLEPMTLDLVRDQRQLIEAIRQSIGDGSLAVLVLDTLNRSLRGSESSDGDMTAYIRAADAIREAFDCAVIIVHHCGVNGTRPRGHTSLTGAVNAQIAIKKDASGTILTTVEFIKDGQEGEAIASRLEKVEIGIDEDGAPITSCVVVPAEVTEASHENGQKLTANQHSMLNILEDAGPAGLATEEWNDEARKHGIGATRRATLFDLRKALKDKKLVHSYGDRWYVTRHT